MMTESLLVDKIVEEFSSVKWTQIIDAIRPDDIMTIDISKDPWGDLYLEDQGNFKELAKKAFLAVKAVRLTGIRVAEIFKRFEIKLVSDDEIQMQDINSTVEGQTIAFTSIVVGQVPSKTFVVEGDAVCPNCYSTERIHAGLDRKLHAMTCF